MYMAQYIVEMRNINKSFAGVSVLHDFNMSIKPGEVRALLGENGAGKSTLIKILGGIYRFDSGEISISGEKANITNAHQARDYGISIIHQELSLVKPLSIAENIYLGKQPHTKLGMVDFKKMNRDSRGILDSLGLDIDPTTSVNSISISLQQQVEIARALADNASVIVMDEPTTSLTDTEVELLFERIDMLKEANVAILYISHKLDEIFRIADSVTVIRDGWHINTCAIEETNQDKMIQEMVGRELHSFYSIGELEAGDTVMEVEGFSNDAIDNISFSLRQGEILGFTGLVGSGRTELVKAIFGIDPIFSGKIKLFGEYVQIRYPRDAIAHGIGLVPEDRKTQGLFLSNTISFNMTISVLDTFIKFIRVNKMKEKKIIDDYAYKLAIKMNDVYEQLVVELSGGNQQKVVLSKWLATQPKILIMDEPTRGIDVGAKAEIYHLMHQIASEGVAIIMISSELPEILAISTRIAVMREGKLITILDPAKEKVTQEDIMYYEVGGGKIE